MKKILTALAVAYTAGSAVGAALGRLAAQETQPETSNMLEAPRPRVAHQASLLPREHLCPEEIVETFRQHVDALVRYSEAEGVAFDWETLIFGLDVERAGAYPNSIGARTSLHILAADIEYAPELISL